MTASLLNIKPSKKETIANFAIERYKENKNSMRDIYRSWLVNLAWIRGKQHLDFDSTQHRFIQNEDDPHRTRLHANKMLPLVRKNISRIVHRNNVWDVITATPDEEDIAISRTSTQVLANEWDRLDMVIQMIRVGVWMESIGSCFLKIGWDPELGKNLLIDPADVPTQLLNDFLELQGLPRPEEQLEVPEGQAFCDIVPSFHMSMDPTVAIFSESNYSIETRLRSKDFIVEKFGSKFKHINESPLSALYIYPHLFYQGTDKRDIKGVLTHECMIKPHGSGKFKKGMYFVVTDDGEFIVKKNEFPFRHGELPYGHFVSIIDPVSPWGTCVTEQIRAQQARYNSAISSITDNIIRCSKIQWLNPRQSGIKTFTNEPGKVYNYNSPHKPDQIDVKPMPRYITDELNRINADIQDIASTHDVTQGKAEPGIRSGKAVVSLQEADDSVLTPTLTIYDHELARVGRLLLQTIAEFAPEERIIQVKGEFGEMQTIKFSGETLRGKSSDGDYWKVRVKTAGRQAMTRQGREQLARTLVELGILRAGEHDDLILHIIDAADTISMFDEDEIDRTRQWKEIQIIAGGQQVPVYEGEQHIVHMRVIEKFLSSGKREKFSPEQLEAIVKHYDDHRLMKQTEAAKDQVYLQQATNSLLGVDNVQNQ